MKTIMCCHVATVRGTNDVMGTSLLGRPVDTNTDFRLWYRRSAASAGQTTWMNAMPPASRPLDRDGQRLDNFRCRRLPGRA